MSPRVFKSEKMQYYECLSALDHGAYAADDTASPLESGLLIYKGILGAMLGHHCTVLLRHLYTISFYSTCMHEAWLETAV